MTNRAIKNSFLKTLYEQKNITPKISLSGLNFNSFIDDNLRKELTKEMNEFLALSLLPVYTEILAYRKQIVPDYYYPKYQNDFYEISKYRDFQHFSLTVFFDKELLINAHLFNNIYDFVNQFMANYDLTNKKILTHQITQHFFNYVLQLKVKDIFNLYHLPTEQQKLRICEQRSKEVHKYLNERIEFNRILKNILKDTKKIEKTLVIISESNIYHLNTKQIKNALITSQDHVEALEAHLKLNPLSLYERNHYLSVIIIEPTFLKIKYDIVKIYSGFTLDKSSGFFSIAPENLKKGLNVVKKHWVFRYFNL